MRVEPGRPVKGLEKWVKRSEKKTHHHHASEKWAVLSLNTSKTSKKSQQGEVFHVQAIKALSARVPQYGMHMRECL